MFKKFSLDSSEITLKNNSLSRFVIFIICVFVGIQTIQSINFEYKWKNVFAKQLKSPRSTFVVEEYEKIERLWNGKPFFYYDYASVLRNNFEYEKSISKLKFYKKYVVSYNSELLMAQNYYDEGKHDKAICHFNQARWMCPNRFLPLQGIMRSYKAIGDKKRAIEIANEIKTKQIKINSYTVTLIKKEADVLLNDVSYER